MRELHRREALVFNPKTRQQERIVVLMIQNGAGRHHAIWAGKDESMFPQSAAGKAWAAGEALPLKVEGRSPEVLAKAAEARRRKAVCRGSEER
jgi:hypothetical protein